MMVDPRKDPRFCGIVNNIAPNKSIASPEDRHCFELNLKTKEDLVRTFIQMHLSNILIILC